ncbi:MAG: divalent-cation tolerance protein CutA [Actinomycetota bacterium]|nr:divalent-cation tolerance protein CutA [Actinomycetota bacterium]
MKYIIIYITASSLTEARRISSSLLEKRLVACANISSPIESHYHWQGKLETASEVAVIFKTTEDKLKEVADEIKSLHSYDLPAIISWNITWGEPSYLNWIEKETGGLL